MHINNQLTWNVKGIFESLFLELYGPSKKKILIGEIYRSPSGSVSVFRDILTQILQLIGNQNQDVIIMGDFNINMAFPLTNSSVDLLTIMSGSNLYPSITIPTRVTESTHSLIDNIFSTFCSGEVSIITSDISDHFPIHTVFNEARMPTPLV